MNTEFEREVKTAVTQAKFGDQSDKIAPVDLHFVLPLKVYARYETLISEVTSGDFQVTAGYNLVLLYTDPEDAQRAGTAMFGRDLDGLIAAWSNVLDDIAADPDQTSRLQKFKNAHAHFRGALWFEPNPGDPCASANPIKRNSRHASKPFWRRLLN